MYPISNKCLSPYKMLHPEHDACKNRQAGFTLLELLVVILLMGIMLAIGVGGMLQQENTLHIEANKIIRSIMDARSRAILLNDTVSLELHETYIRVLHNKDPLYTTNLQGQTSIKAMNGKALTDDEASTIRIHHLGILDESTIWLEQDIKRVTLYLPAIGRPKIFDDFVSLQMIHEELL